MIDDKKVLDFCRKHCPQPGWRGRKAKVRISDRPDRLTSMWDGGSRDTYAGVVLATGQPVSLPICGAWKIQTDYVPQPGIAVVEHTIFCGKDIGCKLHLHPADVERFSKEE